MKTIQTTITVLPDGSIQIPVPLALPPGEHRAVLVVQAPSAERKQLWDIVRTTGRLAELSLEEKQCAATSTLTLDEARAMLDRAGGKPLSDSIIEMRGPKG